MNKKIAIIGAGGHGKVIGEIALLNNYKEIDFFDEKADQIIEFPFNIRGKLDYLKENLKQYDNFFVSIGDNQVRKKKIEWLKKQRVNVVTLIHPKSTISKFISIDIGTCVMANAVINPGTSIKEGVIVNTSSSVDHDCILNDFVHISPNCALSGNVKIGKFSHLGTGTSVHPGISIGDNVKTGVGSYIYKNLSNNTIHKN